MRFCYLSNRLGDIADPHSLAIASPTHVQNMWKIENGFDQILDIKPHCIAMHYCLNGVFKHIRLKQKSRNTMLNQFKTHSAEDPGFLERGFICIKVWGFALQILFHFA